MYINNGDKEANDKSNRIYYYRSLFPTVLSVKQWASSGQAAFRLQLLEPIKRS